MQNKNTKNHTLVYITQTTAKVALSAFFFSIALMGGAAPAFANNLVGQELTIIARTNSARAEVGLPPLRVDERLMRSAAAKAADMAANSYFGHADANGNRMNYWIGPESYVYTLAGENLAKGFEDLDRVMNAWIASSTHYKNLTEPKFKDIGVGMAEGWYENRQTLFIVQHFGVEATQTAKDVSQIATVVAPLIEKVAGTTEANKHNMPAQSTPIVSVVTTPTAQVAVDLPEPPAIETAQILTPPTTGGVANVIWPLWAIFIIAAMGYIIDERFILWIQDKFAGRRKRA